MPMLMGFGHRVYKNYDPRAKIIQKTCHEVLEELDLKDDKLFKLAMALEKIALEDDYFVQRKLYPNVDFYSGIVYKALGIPVSMFTAIFALARTVGLDRAVERNDRRPRAEDRPAAPAVYRLAETRFRADGQAQVSISWPELRGEEAKKGRDAPETAPCPASLCLATTKRV